MTKSPNNNVSSELSSPVILEPDYRPSSDEEYMNPLHLEYFRQKLEAWKTELVRESTETIHHLQEETTNEPDMNDRASTETDRALELRTRDRERKLINKIDEALMRIRDESYGYCEETGDPIGLARLEARPIATLSTRSPRTARTGRKDLSRRIEFEGAPPMGVPFCLRVSLLGKTEDMVFSPYVNRSFPQESAVPFNHRP